MLNWIEFFDQHHIRYSETGPGIAKGNVIIHCCWCRLADEGDFLSVNLSEKGFRCWSQPKHSGKNPAKLIQALLNCSWDQANQIAGQSKSLPNDFMNKIKQSLNKQEITQKPNKLIIPKEFKTFLGQPSSKLYYDYLKSRGFTDRNIMIDTINYGIYYCNRGIYKGRIIFTVTQDSKLVGWTGRTIYGSEQVRYKTLTHDFEKAGENGELLAPAPISNFLGFYDYANSSLAATIILCEGPFDAFRLNLLGYDIFAVAVCFFTSTLSKQQLNLLHSLLPKFKNRYLILDQGTFSKASKIRSELVSLGVVVRRLPNEIDDPGDLRTTKQLQEILK